MALTCPCSCHQGFTEEDGRASKEIGLPCEPCSIQSGTKSQSCDVFIYLKKKILKPTIAEHMQAFAG